MADVKFSEFAHIDDPKRAILVGFVEGENVQVAAGSFVTPDDLPSLALVATSGDYGDLTGKPEIPTQAYIDEADSALGERITDETTRATGAETALGDRIDAVKASSEAYTDQRLTNYLTEEETYDAIEERETGALNDQGSVPSRADLPIGAADFDLYYIEDEDIDVYARNIGGVLTWKTLNFTVDLSEYETTAGSTEKAQAALSSANAHTDEVRNTLSEQIADVGADIANVESDLQSLEADSGFYVGYNGITTLEGVPITKRSVLADLSGDGLLSLDGTLPAGREMSIKARNAGETDVTITIPNDGIWESKNTKGENIDSVVVPVGGAIEINIWALDKLIVKTDA